MADDINHRVVKLSPSLGYLTEWGGFGSKPGQLAFPRGLAADPAGETFVADTANDRVQVFDPEGHFLRTIGASAREPGPLTGTARARRSTRPAGCSSPTPSTRASRSSRRRPTPSPATSPPPGGYTTGFNRPAGIAVDPRGSVYVTDPADRRISRFWGDGTYLSEIGGPADVGGAGLSEAGSVAVASARAISTWPTPTTTGSSSTRPRARCSRASAPAAATAPPARAPGEFDHPEAVAVDGAGDIYVADTYNNRVVELSPAGAVLDEWGSRGSGDGRFHSPTGIALDAAGNVYVVDSENNRVEVFDSAGHFLQKWGERGIGPGEFS